MQSIQGLNLKVGDLLEWRVQSPPSKVLYVKKDGVIVTTPLICNGKPIQSGLVIEKIHYGKGNWGRVVTDKATPGALLNEKSGVIHNLVEGSPACGAGFTQNSIVGQQGTVTCERCLKLNKGKQ